jgi:membrane-bound transcription factor site-1 protease
MGAYEMLQNYVPRASTVPASLDLTKCPYMWPYCAQPLYYGSLPVTVNVTVLNGMGVSGEIEGDPYWRPGKNGEILELSFTYPPLLWPWTGYLGIFIGDVTIYSYI